jgi:CubicO group peptidase (beta-lactamase class C family)
LATLAGAGAAMAQSPQKDLPSAAKAGLSTERRQINKAALDDLVDAAQKAHSSALVIWKDGRPYGEWYFDGKAHKIEAMSATKSVVNLAIGKLITEGKIKSLDQPVYDFYPEWKQGRKKSITIRHLLNHTSGLEGQPTTAEIYASPNFVQLALAAELSSDPGTTFFYNNKAVNLLAGIVQKASGKRMDVYIGEEIFKPLGIADFSWTLDRAGNPHAMSGLQILPADFAKIGQLVLDRGKWNLEQIISESWFDESLRAGQPFEPTCGLLWWLASDQDKYVVGDELANQLASHGASQDLVARARSIQGKYENRDALRRAFQTKIFGSDQDRADFRKTFSNEEEAFQKVVNVEAGPITSYSARGYLGQFVVIIPRDQLVLVRMVEGSPTYNAKTDGLGNIEELARGLIQ